MDRDRRDHGSSLPIIAFAITGYSSVLLWRNTVSRCIGGIRDNANLLYHRNVRVIDVYATRILLELCGATASFAVLTLIFLATGSIQPLVDPLTVVAGWAMLGWFGAALAIFIGSAATFSHLVNRVWHPVSYLLFPLSGAAYMVDWLPPSRPRGRPSAADGSRGGADPRRLLRQCRAHPLRPRRTWRPAISC